MSLQTWESRYYPREAYELHSATDEECTLHSLRKWVGLRAVTLRAHGLRQSNNACAVIPCSLLENGFIYIDDQTCALCAKHENPRTNYCKSCPLNITLNGRCDVGDDAPYRAWRRENNPRPMIRALIATLRRLRQASTGE